MEMPEPQAPLFPVKNYGEDETAHIPEPGKRHPRNPGRMTRTQLLELANRDLERQLRDLETKLAQPTHNDHGVDQRKPDPRQSPPPVDNPPPTSPASQFVQDEYPRPVRTVATEAEMKRHNIWMDLCFRYHKPKADQIDRYHNIRLAGRRLAETIAHCCPVSAEQTIALQRIREVVMWANASIACNESENI
jgi:hypothetical protein